MTSCGTLREYSESSTSLILFDAGVTVLWQFCHVAVKFFSDADSYYCI